MNIGFLGLGKLGLPVSLAVEDKGHNIYGYDISSQTLEDIRNRKIRYREEWVEKYLPNTKLEINDINQLVKNSEIIFVPIQTPHDPQYEGVTRIPDKRIDFDYSFLKSGIKSWLNIIKPLKISDVGSSLKFCYLAEGKYDIYPRSIPTMEWDTAAGHSILKASGGNIFTTNGLELYYGKNHFKNGNFIAFSNYKNFPLSKYFLENIEDYKVYIKRIETASSSLKNGKLVVFPTETVFGLGAIGTNEQAISAIYAAKNRPQNNPLIASKSMA